MRNVTFGKVKFMAKTTHTIYHEFDYEWDPSDFRKWFQDQLTLEWYNVLIWAAAMVAWASIAKRKALSQLFEKIKKKAAKKLWAKLAAKAVPFLWRWLLALDIALTANEIRELDKACKAEENTEGYSPWYYRWRRTVVMAFVWIGFVSASDSFSKVKTIFSNLSDIAKTQKKRIQKLLWDSWEDVVLENFTDSLREITEDTREKVLKALDGIDDITAKWVVKRFPNRWKFDFADKIDEVGDVWIWGKNVKLKNADEIEELKRIRDLPQNLKWGEGEDFWRIFAWKEWAPLKEESF